MLGRKLVQNSRRKRGCDVVETPMQLQNEAKKSLRFSLLSPVAERCFNRRCCRGSRAHEFGRYRYNNPFVTLNPRVAEPDVAPRPTSPLLPSVWMYGYSSRSQF